MWSLIGVFVFMWDFVRGFGVQGFAPWGNWLVGATGKGKCSLGFLYSCLTKVIKVWYELRLDIR